MFQTERQRQISDTYILARICMALYWSGKKMKKKRKNIR